MIQIDVTLYAVNFFIQTPPVSPESQVCLSFRDFSGTSISLLGNITHKFIIKWTSIESSLEV